MPVISYEELKRAIVLDLTAEQGVDLDFPITITDLDVTGYTAKLQVRPYEDSDDVLFEMSTDNSKISTEDGTVKLMFAAADFVDIDWDAGVYDILITSPGSPGKKTRVMEGKFYVDRGTTR